MKKRCLSMLLLFMFIIGMSVPAAASKGNAYRFLDLTEIDPDSSTTRVEAVSLDDGLTADVNSKIISNDPDVYVNSITVHPIIAVYEGEQGTMYIINDITRSVRFTSKGQFQSLNLTNAGLQSVIKELPTGVANDPTLAGKKVLFVGWDVSSVFTCIAESPQYIEYTPTSTCINGTATKRITVTGKHTQVTVDEYFFMPENINDYYHVGVRGSFMFIRTSGPNSGQQGGFGISAGLTVNSDKR